MGFFKAYDMRGTFGVDFDLDAVYKVGKALPQVVKGGRWLVGRDGRTTSASVRDALVKGLRESGAEVVDIGLCTTPMVYFFTAEDGFDGSVMITASHNPPSDNGERVILFKNYRLFRSFQISKARMKSGIGLTIRLRIGYTAFDENKCRSIRFRRGDDHLHHAAAGN